MIPGLEMISANDTLKEGTMTKTPWKVGLIGI